MFARDSLRNALDLLGALLADRGDRHELVTVGGGSLLLTGAIGRPTKDLDALALVVDGICLKLYAAADDGPAGKHFADLRQLDPSDDELQRAAIWVKAQDLSPEFKSFVDQIIAKLEVDRAAP